MLFRAHDGCGRALVVERLHETDHMRGLVIPGRHRTSAVADVRIVNADLG
jgi:hypothetical protein